jgi:hypothetical protein
MPSRINSKASHRIMNGGSANVVNDVTPSIPRRSSKRRPSQPDFDFGRLSAIAPSPPETPNAAPPGNEWPLNAPGPVAVISQPAVNPSRTSTISQRLPFALEATVPPSAARHQRHLSGMSAVSALTEDCHDRDRGIAYGQPHSNHHSRQHSEVSRFPADERPSSGFVSQYRASDSIHFVNPAADRATMTGSAAEVHSVSEERSITPEDGR